ncbi:MAG: hypothetical protein ACJ762_03855 [Solirubrobacteraceae bacterium]
MKSHRPSPALVVSIVALIVALGGTAVAAKVLITSSAQIKNRTISGLDLKDGAITKRQISKSTLSSLKAAPSSGGSSDTQALESHRQTGPDVAAGGSQQVASLALQPGVYAVFAKTTITPFITDDGLLDTLFKDEKTRAAECNLDVSGTGDFATAPIVGPGSTNPATLNVQATRTLDGPGSATLTCKTAAQAHWQASNTSIIALKVGGSTRTEAAK